jgi:hypothetical protein
MLRPCTSLPGFSRPDANVLFRGEARVPGREKSEKKPRSVLKDLADFP